MAYRFDGVDDRVSFNAAAVNGYTAGAVSQAMYFKRNNAGVSNRIGGVDASSSLRRFGLGFAAGNQVEVPIGSTARVGTTALASTTTWYIVAVTWAGGTATPRFHYWNGSAWVHENATSAPAGSLSAWTGADPIVIGSLGATVFGAMDCVCAGIDKANHTDGEIETLTHTAFQTWLDFGFDWLVGFQTGAALEDQGTGGSGDETSRVGTTVVSDPAGWDWAQALWPDPADTDWVPLMRLT